MIINIWSGDDEVRGMLLRYLTDRSVDLETLVDAIAHAYAQQARLTDTFGDIDQEAVEKAYAEELAESIVCNGPMGCLTCGQDADETTLQDLWRAEMDATGETTLFCRVCGREVIYPGELRRLPPEV